MAEGKLNKKTKYTLRSELRKNQTRGVAVPKPLSDAKIARNLEELQAHFVATQGAKGAKTFKNVVTTLPESVQNVYQLLEDQTTTIVAAIDGRADVIDTKLDRQLRILTGNSSTEDLDGMTNLEKLAQNCQAVRSLQNHNIQLRAESVAQQKAQKLEVKAKKLEAKAQKKANKVQKTIVKPTI